MPELLYLFLFAGLLVVILVLLFYPKIGLLSHWRRARGTAARVLVEDALKHLYRCEAYGRRADVQSLAAALQISTPRAATLLDGMHAQDLLVSEAGELRLTAAGRAYALNVIRAHRLWERYLAEESGYPQADWHGKADQREHFLTPQDAEALSSQLGNPTHDPHGDPIPSSQGEFKSHGGQPLSRYPQDTPLRVVHLEDEPPDVYARLVAKGLHPGMQVRVSAVTSQQVRLLAGEQEYALSPDEAGNIFVRSISPPQQETSIPDLRLAALRPGQQGRVAGISLALRGAERRRLLDLGITQGTLIAAEFRSPSGDPTAYRLRGALVALRREQAEHIAIIPL